MSKIDFNTYLQRLNNYDYHFYDIPSEICYFPFKNEEIDMKWLSTELNNFGEYLKHDESFEERKSIAKDDEWHDFAQNLKKKYNYTCQLSGINYTKAKELSYKLFHINSNCSWINNWVVLHHIDDEIEYKCFDESKFIVLNRAVHLIKHRYNNLVEHLPILKYDFDTWFELGCLIHDRDGKYPWRNIVKK